MGEASSVQTGAEVLEVVESSNVMENEGEVVKVEKGLLKEHHLGGRVGVSVETEEVMV